MVNSYLPDAFSMPALRSAALLITRRDWHKCAAAGQTFVSAMAVPGYESLLGWKQKAARSHRKDVAPSRGSERERGFFKLSRVIWVSLMDDTVPIRIIRGIPALFIVLVSLALAFAADLSIFPGHGRIVFFSTAMSGFAVYSTIDIIRKPSILLLVSTYILTHIFISFLAPADDSYYGAVLIPAAIFDYIAFTYAAYFIYKAT
jgi:hypothetical protein